MRLRQKRNLLEEALPYLTINSTPKPTHGQTLIHNFIELKEAIEKIDQTELFDSTIDLLKLLNFWNAYSETVAVDDLAFQNFKRYIDELIVGINLAIESFNRIISVDNEYTLSIKIPRPNSFGDLTEISRSLDLIFGQTLFLPDIAGSVEIKNFDMGSFWIDILVGGGAPVMHFIGAMAWSGAMTYKKIQEGRLVSEQVRELKISNDAKEETAKGLEEQNKVVAQQEATFIAEQHLTTNNPEDILRIELAINEIAKLYIRGGEIHLSIEAPDDIREEFPKMIEISTLTSKIKLISKHSKEAK